MIKEYIAYLKDNPNQFWFKRKLYGWGWTPATWQGWMIMGAYLLLVICLALAYEGTVATRESEFSLVFLVIFLTILFIRICIKTGEKPTWQRGKPKSDEI